MAISSDDGFEVASSARCCAEREGHFGLSPRALQASLQHPDGAQVHESGDCVERASLMGDVPRLVSLLHAFYRLRAYLDAAANRSIL